MKKNIFMIFLGLFLIVSTQAIAQESQDQSISKKEQIDGFVRKMDDDLKLSATQKEKITDLLLNRKPSEEKISLRNTFDDKLKKILTTRQYGLYINKMNEGQQ